jgi:hypothetical protein
VINLDHLLVELGGLGEQEIEELGRSIYEELYITSGARGIHQTHDQEEVYFWKDRFEHAFFSPQNWRVSGRKIVIDKARVARVRWIGVLIAGEVPNTECWSVKNAGRPDNRIYASFAKGYIAWLEARDAGGWKFSTAYNAEAGQIRKYLRGGQRIWKFGQNKSP